MSKAPMVTRTVHRTEATLLCLDVNQAEPFNKTVSLPGHIKAEKDILKAAKKLIDTDDVKAVHVVDVTSKEARYGMTEEEFLLYAKPINSATSNAGATDVPTENN